MGNTSSMLTQYDIEEVQQHCNNAFSQQEIVSLYERFCQLDRNGGGFVSGEEFLSVPEFAVNPLSQRLLRMLDGLNFKEFVAFLSAFSPRATVQQKIEFIFKVYDSDGNGKVTFNDMLDVLHDLTGQFISEQQREQVLTKVLEEAGYTKESLLVMSDFVKAPGDLKFFKSEEGQSDEDATSLDCCCCHEFATNDLESKATTTPPNFMLCCVCIMAKLMTQSMSSCLVVLCEKMEM
ncbi:hypothetical protein Goshw_030361 [Gossypium schwendimanii]|uniref:EF-hand domain-containing protein n=1 Tax=Gossypium schwendimanii TaxID=34291 RepID=A0A7J9MYW0_GOSSC|nr:hypothetical protein [Gossypium schwendimanii]